DSRARLLLVLAGFIVIATAITGRLAFWQVVRGDELAAMAVAQTTVRIEESSQRGTIYDRTGTVVLASTVVRSRLAGSPAQLSRERRQDVADRLVAILGLEGPAAESLIAKMKSAENYVVLARGLDAATSGRIRERLADGSLAALSLEEEAERVYPQVGGGPGTMLAAHLLGFVNSAGEGQYGVEQVYQAALAGKPKVLLARRTMTGEVVADDGDVVDGGSAGMDVTLTIDASLQLAIEEELLAAFVADRARSVSAVVMDPFTGEIYAQATYPSYDANDYQQIAMTDKSRFIDPIVSAVYEPGSVFKMFTAIAALKKGVVKPTSIINDSAVLVLDDGRNRVRNADLKGKGKITFEDVIAYSRNVGAAKVAMRLGKSTTAAAKVLFSTWEKMGFGRPTGIDLAGEVSGLLNDPAKRTWREIDLANGAFGQGVAVTPIQLARAYAAMVNGGLLIGPHVVRAIGSREMEPAAGERVMTAQLSASMVTMLNHVVTEVDFLRPGTLAEGYYVGGKTGTAQIWDPTLRDGRGDWKQNIFNYSFVGFIGDDKPRLVVAVRINEGTPTVVKQGSLEMPVMSFELFRRIATDAIKILDLPPSTSVTASR
ncbi:MAG: penicillin-binding protein 2, partial [Chloroflexi bacterium]|nr:penicillin-binding protein 2 [Chloroflexota bacterium]